MLQIKHNGILELIIKFATYLFIGGATTLYGLFVFTGQYEANIVHKIYFGLGILSFLGTVYMNVKNKMLVHALLELEEEQ